MKNFLAGLLAKQRAHFLILLIILLTILIAHRCDSLGMSWYLSVRYWFYAIPSLFSELYYGAMHYTYLADVSSQLMLAQPFDHPEKFQAILDGAKHLPRQLDQTPIYFPGDEKGTVDFVRIAFWLFGEKIESIYRFSFLIFSASLTLCVFRFRKNLGVLFIIALALISFYVAISGYLVTKEVYSITNPRAIGCLSFFALLHLFFLVMRDDKFSLWLMPEVLFQSAVLVLIVSVRTAESWQIIALVCFSLLVVCKKKGFLNWKNRILLLLPIISVLALQGGYHQYQNHVYPEKYFDTNLRNKMFWHNFLIGFGLNPVFAEKYGLDGNEGNTFLYVKGRAKAENIANFDQIFFPAGQEKYAMVRNYIEYEALCKNRVWEIVKRNKYQTAKLFVYYKTVHLFRSLAYASGHVNNNLSYYNLSEQAGSLLSNEQRVEKSAFYKPFSLFPLLCILIAAYIVGRKPIEKIINSQMLLMLLVICLSSLIPGFLTYPTVHVIASFYFTFALLLYSLVMYIGLRLNHRSVAN